jgi:tRNA (cmo5U34)-methyltransferase
MTTRGGVGDSLSAGNAGWTFGGSVADTFDSHVRRSVPLYEEGHVLAARLSDFFVKEGSLIYDLGCSTGALTGRLAERHASKHPRIVGVEREAPMAAFARRRCEGLPGVEIVEADLVEFDLEPADLIVASYTVQFISPRYRQDLITRIYEALNWGGALVLFEKVRGPDARFQDIASSLYVDFKLEQGFTEEEIVNKAQSLKGVLEPFSTQGNLDLMRRAGFTDVMTVLKYVCFEGFLAIK